MDTPEVLKRCHLFEVDGRRFAYEPVSMVVFAVDQAADDLLRSARAGEPWTAAEEAAVRSRDGAAAAEGLLGELRELGLLGPPETVATPERRPGLTGITLNVSHGCNLRCSYCFAGAGEYGLGKALMTPETGRAAIDWLGARRRPDTRLAILFFGGEPMLNMKAIRETVLYAKEHLETPGHPLRLQMTTNGTLLTEKNVRTLVELGLEPQISLDGRRDTNDRRRLFADGTGSYDRVTEGAARLRQATGRVSLRATISSGHGDFFDTALHFINTLGATRANFEPASGPSARGGITEIDLAAINAAWTSIAEEFYRRAQRRVLWPIGKLMNLLEKIHWRRRGHYGCTAGVSAVAVDPCGDLYPCHRFVGNPAWKMGNVFQNTLDEAISSEFADNSVDKRTSCNSCWARYLCAGRCVHEAMEVTGTIGKPDPLRCGMMRHLSEEALRLYVRIKPLMGDRLARREPLAEERAMGTVE